MQVRGCLEASVGTEAHADAVGDLESRSLALVVEEPDEVAGGALGAQVVVERRVDGDREATLLGQRELLVRGSADLDVVDLEP